MGVRRPRLADIAARVAPPHLHTHGTCLRSPARRPRRIDVAGDNRPRPSARQPAAPTTCDWPRPAATTRSWPLLFQYGRYLLIASCRPGTQPANLQGIWNDSMQPPWSSNYTININTEMNYWPAEVANLAECHEPLLDCIERARADGRGRPRGELRRARLGRAPQHRPLAADRSGRRSATAIPCGRTGRWAARGWRSTCGSTTPSAATRSSCATRAYPVHEGGRGVLPRLAGRGRRRAGSVTAPSTSPENDVHRRRRPGRRP